MKSDRSSATTSIAQISAIAAVVALSLGAAGSVQAGSCQNVLQGHLNWLSQTPTGYERSVGVVMVSNFAPTFLADNMPLPQATYLNTELIPGEGFFEGDLVGEGGTMFNDRTWSSCGLCPQHPFDPNDTDDWVVILAPSSSSMLLDRGNNAFVMPLDCEGNLIVGTYAQTAFGVVVSRTKYVLSLYRVQVTIPL